MDAEVLIVGVNGVGKEHIRACNTLRVPYWLMDINLNDFRDRDYVYNVWGKHKEQIMLSGLIGLCSSMAAVPWHRISHAIVATPDATHESVIKEIQRLGGAATRIYVEKPAECHLGAVSWVGYLNLFPKLFQNEARYYVEHVQREWSNGIVDDLLGHLFYSYTMQWGLQPLWDISVEDKKATATLLGGQKLYVERDSPDTLLVLDGEVIYPCYEKLFLDNVIGFLQGKTNIQEAAWVAKELARCVA